MNWNHIICKMTCILVLLACGIIGVSAVDASNPICPADTILCNGTCTDTGVDLLNCGSCGKACPVGTACVNGNCSCLMGLELCNGSMYGHQLRFTQLRIMRKYLPSRGDLPEWKMLMPSRSDLLQRDMYRC